MITSSFGLSEEQALRAITIDAARILGLDNFIGSLAPGKDADLVVWSDYPLLLAAKPELVMIDGHIGEVDQEQQISHWRG